MNENTFGESRTFRGASLDEVLPKIRSELGPDAVILREREGIVGGLGGFFGKRCVEIEAAPTWPLLEDDVVQALPAHDAAVLYQSGLDGTGPPENRFMEALLDRAAALDELFVPVHPAGLAVTPEPAFEPVVARERPTSPSPLTDEYDVRLTLAEVGMTTAAIDEVVRRAVAHLRPLAPDVTVRDLVRRALRDAVATPVGWNGRRAISLASAGTATDAVAVAGGLARPFSSAGARVAVVALGGGRDAARLGGELGGAPVELLVAHDVRDAEQAARRTLDADLVLAVAPRVADGDERSQRLRAGLLIAFGADETHLVLDAGLAADAALRAYDLLDVLVPVGGLLPVGIELEERVGGVVGLAVARRLGIRWLASGETPVSVTTADPSSIAGACLR